MKENIIKALKDNKKLILLIGAIFISGIIIGVSVSTLNFSNPKKYYFATDDIGLSSSSTDPFSTQTKISYDTTVMHFGWSQLGTANPTAKGFIMRFYLSNKPRGWTKCEISLYVYQKIRNGGSGLMYLFAGNWTEEEWDGYGNYMRDFEIYWKLEDSIGGVSNTVGFDITDITEYINDITTSTFSIAVLPKSTFDGLGYIFSSEWDNTDPIFPYGELKDNTYKSYLPQLIWS